MRIKASVGVFAGLACLTASAVVRRYDVDTTCTTTTTDRSPLVVTVPDAGSAAASNTVLTVTAGMPGPSVSSSAISASVLTFTLSAGTPGITSSAATSGNAHSASTDDSAPVFTVTVPAVTSGTSDTTSLDTTCTSSDIFTLGGSTSAASGPVTVTVTEMPFGTTPAVSTVTVPVVTVTLPGPPPPGWPFDSTSAPAGPLVTLTIPGGNGGSGSDMTVTVPLASILPSSTPAITAPQPTGPAGSVVTVTIPEGSGHTATIVLTITVPDGGLDSWSTIITVPGEAGTPTGPIVTVSASTTSGAVPSVDTTCASPGISDLPSSPESAMTITYTLPMESGMTSPSTGVMTITLSPPVSAPVSNGPFGSWPAGSPMPTFGHHSSPSVGPAMPPSVSTTCSESIITFTIPAISTYSAFTGTLTLSDGAPQLTATDASPAVITLTSTVPAGDQGSPNGETVTPSFSTGIPGQITTTLLGETLTFAGSTLPTGPSPYISHSAGSGHPTQSSNGGEGGSSSSDANVFTVTLPGGQGVSSATDSIPSEETLTLSVSPSVSGLPGLFTVTIPEGPGSPASLNGGYTGTNTGVFTVTASVTPHGTSTSPTATESVFSGFTPSVGTVTYTIPFGPANPESTYTVTFTEFVPSASGSGASTSEVPGYGSPDITSGSSIATPSSASGPAVITLTNEAGSPTVLTLTPKGSLTPSKTAGSGLSPVTVTITDASGSPEVLTLTLTQGSSPATITSAVSSTSQPGSGATPVTYTFTDASGSPHVVTLTPPGESQPATVTSVVASASIPGSGTSPLTVTISDSNGLPHTVTLTLSGEGSVPTETSEVPGYGNGGANGGSTQSVITVRPLSGTPFVATITLSGGAVPTSTPESSEHLSTLTIEQFSTLTFGTASLLTATLSGSPIVITIPVGTGKASTATASTQSGRPLTTMTIPFSGSSTRPTGAAGATPSIVTVTLPNGTPVVVTIPLGGSSATVPGGAGGPTPSVHTLTSLAGSQSVITIPLTGETSTSPAGYGGVGPSGSLVTVTLDSGSSIVLTVPVGGHSATSSGVQASTVTETIGSSLTSGLGHTASLITLTLPSGSPIVVTVPLNGASQGIPTVTGPAGYGGSPATITAPSVVTSASTGSNGHGTVSVSAITLTETVPIGTDGSVTVIQVTTEVTLGPSSVGKSASVSTLVLTPTVMTYTMPGAYGHDGTVLTVTTNVPVSTQSPSVEELTFTLPTAAPSTIASTSTCTSDQDASAVQPEQGSSTAELSLSVITIFPASATDTTCTTFTTVVRSSGKPAGSDSGEVSVVTVSLGSGSSTVLTIPLGAATATQGGSSTCSDTSTQTSSTVRTETVTVGQITGALTVLTFFPDQTDSSSVSLDVSGAPSVASELPPPPQTEFLGAESTQDVPGYTFATAQPAAYGNPVPAYGSPPSGTSAEEPIQGSETSTLVTPTITLSTVGSASASSDDQPTPTIATSTDSTPVGSTSATDTISATVSALNATSTEATSASASLNSTSLVTESPSRSVVPTVTGSTLPSASCGSTGNHGQSMLTFDDVQPSNDTGSDTQVSVDIPSTYRRFQLSHGFSVVDSSVSRYAPSSGNQMIAYSASSAPIAQINLADQGSNACFSFDFLGVSLGCNATGADCNFAITGVQWNGTHEIAQASKTIQIAGCTESSNCTMLHQSLDSAAASQFTNLTALNISLTVDGQPQAWWADDLSVAWTDNTCEGTSCGAVVPPVQIMVLNPRRAFTRRVLRWMA
ncbi:hypothetical protein V8F33_005769 [Rhypophila sp. PSN 637]